MEKFICGESEDDAYSKSSSRDQAMERQARVVISPGKLPMS